VNPATGVADKGGQVALAGVYLPTVGSQDVSRSAHPDERDPRLVLVEYTGDLGLDDGVPRSVYTLDQRQIASGRLTPAGEPHRLRPGETWALPGGGTLEFVGTRPWVTLSVRHDPGELPVLASAWLLLIGLLGSLTGRRRRFWFRVGADGVEAGGLPRSDYPGFADEFEGIVRAAREEGVF